MSKLNWDKRSAIVKLTIISVLVLSVWSIGKYSFPHLGFFPILSHMTKRIAATIRLNSMTKG